jgi:hypothetical protein
MRPVLAALAFAALAFARPARAGAEFGLGADWLTDPRVGELQLTLAASTSLARHVSLGARFGMMYIDQGDHVGVPLDGRLRIHGDWIYAEGLVGPWLVFGSGDTVRLHTAFGFGLYTRSITFGFEVGWLDPTPVIGARVAFPL